MNLSRVKQAECAAAVVVLAIAAAFAVPPAAPAVAAPGILAAGADTVAAAIPGAIAVGPSWAWVATLCISCIGVLIGAVAAVFMWALNGKIDTLHADLAALKQRLDKGDLRFAAIEAQRGEDRLASERRLTAMETRMAGVLDELKHAARQRAATNGGSQG